jgi:hypothetical protein
LIVWADSPTPKGISFLLFVCLCSYKLVRKNWPQVPKSYTAISFVIRLEPGLYSYNLNNLLPDD